VLALLRTDVPRMSIRDEREMRYASTASAVAPQLGGNLPVPGGIGAVDARLIGTFVLYHAPQIDRVALRSALAGLDRGAIGCVETTATRSAHLAGGCQYATQIS